MQSIQDPAPVPAPIYMDGTYLKNNDGWHQEDSPYKCKLVSETIERTNTRFETCCDVGCGAGLVSELLSIRFPQARFFGFELSLDAAGYWSRRQARSNLCYSNTSVLASDDVYDLVLCLDVFEHVEDCYGFLRSLRCKGRRFIFNVPLDMNVMKLMTPGIKIAREEVGHLHYFNAYTALRTLEDTGYRILDHKLAVAFMSVPPRNLRQALILPLRLLSLLFGRAFASTVFGGTSLVVMAAAD